MIGSLKNKNVFEWIIFYFKVQLFWEVHKNLRNLPHGLNGYLVDVQTMRKIVQIYLAFSEKLNFTEKKVVLPSAIDTSDIFRSNAAVSSNTTLPFYQVRRSGLVKSWRLAALGSEVFQSENNNKNPDMI